MAKKVMVFSAPSGAGKTTIVRHLLENFDNLEFSVSATSRAPRGQEKNGRDYYFLTEEEFRKRIENDEFVEYEEVYPGSFYGTLKSEVERIWAKGNVIMFDVDVKGGVNIKKIFGEKSFTVFIQPPSLEIMEQRLRARGTDSDQAIKTRIAKAAEEMTYAAKFDTVLVNDVLEESFAKAERLVTLFTGQKPKNKKKTAARKKA
ncbi:MAG: guanylate kinase [Bacteroidales bacterium]|jgi:guanylate kinase|nr:guanylate kinase [Bacteroidales bacterium]MBQ1886025.1 guanylate kinase [Bacteroidales bacterium]MBR2135501.1 guanylate kinase [Bacteroidales bacterium]